MRGRPGREGEMLVVQHAEHEGPGLLSPALEACGLPIRIVRTFAGEPVLGVFAPETIFFHWHGDTFDLPGDAVLLASSSLYRKAYFTRACLTRRKTSSGSSSGGQPRTARASCT